MANFNIVNMGILYSMEIIVIKKCSFSYFLSLRWLALFLSLKSAYRLHHQRLFGPEDAGVSREEAGRLQPRSDCLSRKALILWLNRPTNFPNAQTSPVVQVRNHTHTHTHTTLCAASAGV